MLDIVRVVLFLPILIPGFIILFIVDWISGGIWGG